MNNGAEAADQLVRQSIQVTESATKLAGLGAKNLAALLLALAKENTKLSGKTNLSRLLLEGKPPAIIQIKYTDLKQFTQEAKSYGVLFTAIRDKTNALGQCDLIIRQEDAPKINRIFERMGYGTPDFLAKDNYAKADSEKKTLFNAPPKKKLNEQKNGLTQSAPEMTTKEKPSVKGRIAALKMANAELAQNPNLKQTQKTK